MNVIFLSDILLSAIAAIWLFAATLQDIKKREVANWLSFSLIIIALGLRAIASIISGNLWYFLWGIGATAIIFGLANLFYYLRVFAGGDAKLLTAIGAAFATTPFFTPLIKTNASLVGFQVNLPFLAIFIINTLFVGSAYGLIFSIFLSIRNFKSFSKEFSGLSRKYAKQIFILVLLAIFFFLTNKYYFADEFAVRLLSMLIFIFPFLFIFVKSVENACMILFMNPSKLTEGDWIVNPIKIGKRVITPRFDGLSLEEISLLKKRGKKVMVKQGIPFVPVFLIALFTSFFVDILEFLLALFI